MAPLLDLRSLSVPVVQGGMGSVSRHELAAAVSEAGGLGTIAGVRAPIADELVRARRLTGQPIAGDLLLPVQRPGGARAASRAGAGGTLSGTPRPRVACTWIQHGRSV